MNLEANTPLYRYTFVNSQPPSTWSPDFKNPEYTIERVKNEIGAYYFFLNLETTKAVASIAKSTLAKRGLNEMNTCFVTNCCLTESVSLLDLRYPNGRCDAIVTLNQLFEEDINVLTDQFVKHDGTPFSSVESSYTNYQRMLEKGDLISTTTAELVIGDSINTFFRGSYGSMFGQMLTDYGNGVLFKQMLLTRGYEGYIFDEERSSHTVCLFDSDKLTQPEHHIIEV